MSSNKIKNYAFCVRCRFRPLRNFSSILTFNLDVILHRQIWKLSRILHLGFREWGNLDWGWQFPHTVNRLFLPSLLHIIAPRQPNPILSQVLLKDFSWLFIYFGSSASISSHLPINLHVHGACFLFSSALLYHPFGVKHWWSKPNE